MIPRKYSAVKYHFGNRKVEWEWGERRGHFSNGYFKKGCH